MMLLGGVMVVMASCHGTAPKTAVDEGKEGRGVVSGWRGDGTGVFAGATPPMKWSGDKKEGVGGILWKVKVGKTLFNSPVVVGEKVFVLADPDKLVCLDTNSGKELWSKTTTMSDYPGKVEEEIPSHDEVANTTPTPVTDGRNIYVFFANGLVSCFDLGGTRKWIVFLNEPSATAYGRSASPCLVDGKLVVSAGRLTALDAQTGKVVWTAAKVVEQFGSPVAAKVGDGGGEALVVSPSGHVVKAADGTVLTIAAANGKVLDKKGFGDLMYASPLVIGDKAYFMDADAYAMQLSVHEAEIKRLWRSDMEGEFFASPVCYEGLIYAVSNQGQLYVSDAATGKAIYDKKLEIANMSGDPSAPAGNIYQSICVAGGRIYLSNEQGETLVLEPGREYKELAHNYLGQQVAGSLTFAGKRIYVRTKDGVCCIE